jgi:hypothetical protein
MVRRKRDKLDASAGEEHVTRDVQSFGAVAHEDGKGRLDLVSGAGVVDLNLQSHCPGGFRYVSYALGTCDIGRIDQHGNANGLGHQLVQKCQPLGGDLPGEKIDPRQVSARPGEAGDKTELDGVFRDAEDDRDRRGRSLAASAAALPAGVAITTIRRRTRSAMSARIGPLASGTPPLRSGPRRSRLR